jgi:hypothetical protein
MGQGLPLKGRGGRVRTVTPLRQDAADSLSRRRPETWRSLFVAPWISLRPGTAFLSILLEGYHGAVRTDLRNLHPST